MRKFILILCVAVCGCTRAERAQLGGFGQDFKVTLYNGGQEVRAWKSQGKVLTEYKSDGWYFMDAETKKLVRVSGAVVVEQL